jgi:hypothetical protein
VACTLGPWNRSNAGARKSGQPPPSRRIAIRWSTAGCRPVTEAAYGAVASTSAVTL